MAKRIIKPDSGNTLVLQEDNGSIDALTVETDGDVTLGGDLVVTNIQATSGQSLTIKDEDGNAAITIGTDSTAHTYLSLNFGSYHGDSGGAGGGTLTGNTLDDYEEGTFDLVGKDSGGSTVFTATSQVYQKIGNRCFVEILFTNSTATNAVKLDGLPFVASGQSWAPNSQFFDRYTTVNNGTSYVTWATSSNATHTIRMQFSYQTV